MKFNWIPRYKATDADGEMWYFENEPRFNGWNAWELNGGRCMFVGQIKPITNKAPNVSLKLLFQD